MGISIYAVIEYDDSQNEEAFAASPRGVIPLTDYWDLRDSKDLTFLKLTKRWGAGSRNELPKGLPISVSQQAREDMLSYENEYTSWSDFEEILEAMESFDLSLSDLEFQSQVVLGMMERLALWLGPSRVRIIVSSQ